MTVDQSLAAAPAPDTGESHEPFSATWWERRTAEELRDMINRGFAGGQVFHDAVAEAERRAGEETKRLREVAAIEAVREIKRKKIIRWAIAASILGIAIVVAM